jgi:excinuclease ABC subunit A
VRFRRRTIDELCRMPLGLLRGELEKWSLPARDRKIVGELLREIGGRVQFLNDVGLDYLSLGRGAATLSNGEAQRIRLASQLGSGLCGVLYVLDEPTIGLHPRDNTRLLRALHKLRDLGNTLIVVEHDREVIDGADSICDFGPGAGRLGGQVVAQATPQLLGRRRGSVTGPYLNGKKAIPVPAQRRIGGLDQSHTGGGKRRRSNTAAIPTNEPAPQPVPPGGGWLEIRGARHNNLQRVDVAIPLGTLTAITGPSGSGKSSLVEDVLYNAVARTLHRAGTIPGAHDEIRGLEHVNKVIRVDQQALGNSPTSNPATYTGVFALVRQLFAQLPEAKVRGYTGRRFSFNVPGGRCEACEGNGQTRIEMHFLPDIWVQCETCRGRRYNPETLAVQYHGRSISDVLDMTCGDAARLFENIPKIRRILQTLCDVGLDYLTLGQPAPTLSGGEAQRVKLAAELSRPDTGRTLYLLDEPTTGLHFDDLVKLLEVLQRLVDLGNTVVVIEHNLDVIKAADWIIDMGPEAGELGGRVVVSGTPEDVVKVAAGLHGSSGTASEVKGIRSHTAEALRPVLASGPRVARVPFDPQALQEKREGDLDIDQVGSQARMPWQIDGRAWHTRDRVGRGGETCRWDGRILERVVDRIHELGEFSDTDWDSRSVVEISAKRKSDGWFFHAITGETWLLKMKFRAYRGTFKQEALTTALDLKTLNQLDEIPMYSNEPRVKVRSAQGPWQEVEIRAHTWDEIDTKEFWSFLEDAVRGFFKFTNHAATNLEELTPWKVLGQKWHFLRKGFPLNKSIQWDAKVWDELYQIICQILPSAQFLWNNQQVVRVYSLGDAEPWASVWTKRPDSLIFEINAPKGSVALGRITELGFDRELEGSRTDRDVVKFRFRTLDDLRGRELTEFLRELVDRRSGAQTSRPKAQTSLP